jgi:hypothetical protein
LYKKIARYGMRDLITGEDMPSDEELGASS